MHPPTSAVSISNLFLQSDAGLAVEIVDKSDSNLSFCKAKMPCSDAIVGRRIGNRPHILLARDARVI